MTAHNTDNPRDWDPNHPSLKSPLAPHESAAVLRMHRAGMTGVDMMKILKCRGGRLTKMFQRGLDVEGIAAMRGVPIYDSLIEKGTK